MEKEYKFSEIIELYKKEDGFVIENIITNERFKITHSSFEILRKIKQSNEIITFDLLKKLCININIGEINDFFKFLVVRKVIVGFDEDPKILIMKPVFSLFGHKIENGSTVEHSLVYLGVPFGKGNMVDIGTSSYPEKLRLFSNKYGLKPFTPDFALIPIYDLGNIYFYENEHTTISYIKIRKIIESLAARNNRIFIIGGDHSITFPVIQSLIKIHTKINLIHLDAHTDYYQSKIHDLHEKFHYCSHHHGNFLQKILELKADIEIYQYGLRSLKNEKSHPSNRVHAYKINEETEFLSSLEKLDKNLPTYVTFDIDVIDPINAPATVTPVIGGISPQTMFNLLEKIENLNLNVIGVDLVEINPTKDMGNITMQLSIKIIHQLTKLLWTTAT